LIFSIKTPSRIRIELKRKIDRPEVYRTPEDVPRSVERKVLAVLNNARQSEFLAQHIDIGKGSENNKRLAEKILRDLKKGGRIESIKQLYDLEKPAPVEFTNIINSLDKAFGRMTDPSRFRKSEKSE